MEKTLLVRFRDAIRAHRDRLIDWMSKSTMPDTFRLADAAPQEVTALISEHERALQCIENGDFGKCRLCEGEVEIERLELDFTTEVCLSHYSETQLRQLERDLELAAKVQQQLLPQRLPALPGVQIAVHSEAANIVSGDYFDFFAFSSTCQGIALADVMGKGLPASMLMANLQASLRILGPEQSDLSALARRLNELFRFNLKLIHFISLFLLKVDLRRQRLHYCNAGHHPAPLWQAGSGTIRWLAPTGPAIGLTPEPAYGSQAHGYSPGDLLLLYTDGLVEAHNGEFEEFGEERLAAFITTRHHLSAEAFLGELRQAVRDFAGKLSDDLTIIVLKFV